MENQEPKNEDFNEDFEEGGAKQWLRDNLRIIISVLIVVVIAGGIYSYSKRSATPELAGNNDQGNVLEQIAGTSDNKEESATKEEPSKATEEGKGTVNSQQPVAQNKTTDQVTSSATSQETDKSFVETASRGDGTTKLARRALANYLEKNPDSTITPEHKIYIEDYLRKRVAKKGAVRIGTSVEFEKSLIQEAITRSKNLNDKQLQNLHKYSVRVASFS